MHHRDDRHHKSFRIFQYFTETDTEVDFHRADVQIAFLNQEEESVPCPSKPGLADWVKCSAIMTDFVLAEQTRQTAWQQLCYVQSPAGLQLEQPESLQHFSPLSNTLWRHMYNVRTFLLLSLPS